MQNIIFFLSNLQLWVTDITFIKTQKGHAHLALVTDTCSKQTMGYKLNNNTRTSLCINALKTALKNRKNLVKN
ncbi:DDE-type integrase/transposase/recombinase [Bacteroidota bacterium]